MMTTEDACAIGLGHFRAGRVGEAEAVLRGATAADPANSEAWSLLGASCCRLGKLDEAVASFSRAIRLAPGDPGAHNNLGVALAALRRFAEAVASFEEAVRLRPEFAEARGNLASARRDLAAPPCPASGPTAGGGPGLNVLRHDVRPGVDPYESLARQGVALAGAERLEDAAACLRQANRLRPEDPASHNDLGVVLARLERFAEAEECFRQALRLRPDYPEALNNLGNVLCRQRRTVEALDRYRRAVVLAPDYVDALRNEGAALKDLGRYDEAIAAFERVFRIAPGDPDTLNNLGITLGQQGRYAEALGYFDRALARDPDHVDSHKNRAMMWLTVGDYARGWPEYEWRWLAKGFARPAYPRPLWGGEPLEGRTILLSTEQGLGDAIQFIRYAPLVRERGGRVLLGCPPALARVFATCPGIDRVLPEGAKLPPFDVHASLLSLPFLLGSGPPVTMNPEVPYLAADPVLVARHAPTLGTGPGLKVGIAWQGNPQHAMDHARSLRLAQFAPLGRLAGIRWFSLQMNAGSEQLAAADLPFPVTDLGPEITDFADTAAFLKNLDLVITPDTALAHLAGALGVPAWITVSFASDWRWLLDRPDTPWYPTLTLYRQRKLNDWDGVFSRLGDDLDALVRRRLST